MPQLSQQSTISHYFPKGSVQSRNRSSINEATTLIDLTLDEGGISSDVSSPRPAKRQRTTEAVKQPAHATEMISGPGNRISGHPGDLWMAESVNDDKIHPESRRSTTTEGAREKWAMRSTSQSNNAESATDGLQSDTGTRRARRQASVDKLYGKVTEHRDLQSHPSDRKSTRLNSSHRIASRMPSSA